MADKVIQLAPMLGLVEPPFMNALAKTGGFDEMFAPYMVADDNSLSKPSVVQRRYADIDKSVNLVPQLLSNSASAFVYFANLLFDLGYSKVNWNMGCPQPFVVARNRGASLLKDLDSLKRLLEQTLPKLKPTLSVKTRLGYASADEFQQIVGTLNQFPLAELIVHSRTAVQQYDGNADKSTFLSVATGSVNPVVYNGDIVRATDVLNVDIPNLKGYMIGRGAITNPFVALQIKGRQATSSMKDFCLDVQERYVQKRGQGSLSKLKELWFHFSKAFVCPDEVFAKIKPIGNVQDFESAVEQIFERYQLAI